RERAEPREPAVLRALRQPLDQGSLDGLGIRWIALIHDADWRLYDRLVHGPDLERVVASRSIELFRVRSWRGPVVTDSGRTAEPRRLVEPLQGLVSSGPGRWDRPAARGWMRGTRPVSRTSTGLIRL